MRFTPKVRVAFVFPVVAAFAALVPLLWVLLQGLLHRSAEGHLERTLHVVSRAISTHLEASPRELQAFVRGLSSTGGPRITVIDPQGVVLADSSRTWDGVQAMENHGDRPEVVAALADGAGSSVRRSATLQEEYVYSARPISAPDGRVLVLRLAEPMSDLRDLRSRLARLLFASVLASLLAVGAVSWWLHRKLASPLEVLVRGADRLAKGDLAYRNEIPDEEELAALARSLNRLAQRVEEQMALAEAERSHLEVVGASMSEGILVTDENGRATLVNPAFRRLFRVRGEIAGKTALELSGSPRLDDEVRAAMASGERAALEMESVGRRPVAVSIASLTDRSGVVVAARDISDLMALAEIRRDLVANVSHELKTPLAAIRGYAETLRDGALDDANVAERFVDRILDQCRRLQALLEDLLTLSRLERQESEIEAQPVDLAAIVERSAETLRPVAAEREIDLDLSLGEVPRFDGDPEAMEKLCLNLLDNAIKYNERGGRVEVRLRSLGRGIVLEVEDTGPGIPEAALPRLFERFFRVDRGRSRDEGGTGLGLAIVKHAAQRHGGTVEVESVLGRGSTFRIRLPVGAAGER